MDLLPIEMIEIVFSFCPNGSTWKSIRSVSKQWNIISFKYNTPMIDKFTNHLATLLKLFPNKNWNYNYLSANPNITWDIVQNSNIPSKITTMNFLSFMPEISLRLYLLTETLPFRP